LPEITGAAAVFFMSFAFDFVLIVFVVIPPFAAAPSRCHPAPEINAP
jgi:TRAP-type mannitol/chloroaromatic compound transport system permease large subunit